MELKATKAWRITYDDLQSLLVQNEPCTVTTNYGVTLTGNVHNIQHACLKVHIGTFSFAAIQFSDIRRLKAGEIVIEAYKEE